MKSFWLVTAILLLSLRPLAAQILHMDFVSAEVGWLVADGYLVQTDDGGLTWTPLSVDLDGEIIAIDFVTESVGWIVTRPSGLYMHSAILRTDDGGQSWQEQVTFSDTYWISGLQGIDESTAYAVGILGNTPYCSGRVVSTHDAGATWDEIFYSEQRDTRSAWWSDADHGVVIADCDEKGYALTTDDGGATWMEKVLPAFGELASIQFVTRSSAFLQFDSRRDMSLEPGLYVTHDELGTWSQIADSVTSFHAVDSLTVFATRAGELVRTGDGGRTWHLGLSPQEELDWVQFLDPWLGWTAGGARTVFTTEDGGGSWSDRSIGPTAWPDSLPVSVFYDYAQAEPACFWLERDYVFTIWDGSGGCPTSRDQARCEVDEEGRVRAYNHDCLRGTDEGTYGPWVSDGCSVAEEFGYRTQCCVLNFGCPGGVPQLISQSFVDHFLPSSDSLAGDLLIGPSGDIVDLSALGCLKSVGGDVSITSNQALLDLDGLSSLTEIGGNLIVGTLDGGYFGPPPNLALQNVDGLSGVMTIGGDLYVQNNPELARCSRGLAYVVFGEGVAGAIHMSDNALVGDCNGDGQDLFTVGVDVLESLPTEYRLYGNYPNPFNPTTTISYSLPQPAEATLTVFDLLGRQIRVLASGTQPAGTHEVTFDAAGLPSGVYFYRLEAGDYVETKRMVVVK
jgi:photosystem II stability/assembly factor-like uncharacterized protein